MNFILHEKDNKKIAEIKDPSFIIENVSDALDMMANLNVKGIGGVIINKENLSEDFFDLKTGIAGEILQKFSNYSFQLGIVGDFTVYGSKSLRDFIYECNKGRMILFYKKIDDIIRNM